MKIKKKSIIIISLLLLVCFVISCGKKEHTQHSEITEDFCSILTEENLDYLENMIDFMEYFTYIKKLNIGFIDLTAKPEQYEIASDRQTQLIKFGMLVTDMAFLKLIMGNTQLPDYDLLFERYVKELNISSFMRNYLDDYMDVIANEELTDDLFEELKLKFRQNRKDLVNKAKELDEDFLIYVTMGTMLEQTYLLRGIDSEVGRKSIFALNIYIKDNGAPALRLMKNVWNHSCNTNHKLSYEYGKLLLPVYDIMLKNIEASTIASMEEIHIINKNLDEARNNILK